jgi:hypothetical protein
MAATSEQRRKGPNYARGGSVGLSLDIYGFIKLMGHGQREIYIYKCKFTTYN